MSKNAKNVRSSQSKQGLDVRPLSEVKRRAFSTVVYGPSGSGKTTFAATAPKPLLYIDVKDRGTDSIRDVKKIMLREVNSFEDFEDTYWWLKQNPDEYRSVVIDTCTQLQTMAVREVAKANKRKGDPNDWGTMTKRDWGDVAALMKEWLVNYRDLEDLGINVIFIAQDRTFNMSDEEESNHELLAPEVGPALSPSIAKTLNASVSVIANTFIREREVIKTIDGKKKKSKKIEYCLGLGPSALYRRKVRKPRSVEMDDVLVNPEFDDIIEIIKGQ